MTHYHQLWDLPPSPADTATQEIEQAVALQASERERGFIHALSLVFRDAVTVPYSARASNYESAMRALTAANPEDLESQIFFALALIFNASPSDREHRLQNQAVEVLEPLFRRYPDHSGISHYLIHACDNQEPALHGLPAARVYAGVALLASHSLHMPSHIFTRLGLWSDSIASNLAARNAAHLQGISGKNFTLWITWFMHTCKAGANKMQPR